MTQSALNRIVVLACLLALSGCGKSVPSKDAGNSIAGANATAGGAPTALTSSVDAPALATQPSPAPEAKPVVVHAGTRILVTVDQPVSSKTSDAGDRFEASLAAPVMVGERRVIRPGAKVIGTVTMAKSAGKFKGNAELTVTLASVRVDGEKYAVKTTSVTQAGKGRGKRTGIGAGGGAVVGGIVGALAGGGKGAAIGVGAGAGAGAAGAGFTGDRDIEIPAETQLSFTLTEPLRIDGR